MWHRFGATLLASAWLWLSVVTPFAHRCSTGAETHQSSIGSAKVCVACHWNSIQRAPAPEPAAIPAVLPRPESFQPGRSAAAQETSLGPGAPRGPPA